MLHTGTIWCSAIFCFRTCACDKRILSRKTCSRQVHFRSLDKDRQPHLECVHPLQDIFSFAGGSSDDNACWATVTGAVLCLWGSQISKVIHCPEDQNAEGINVISLNRLAKRFKCQCQEIVTDLQRLLSPPSFIRYELSSTQPIFTPHAIMFPSQRNGKNLSDFLKLTKQRYLSDVQNGRGGDWTVVMGNEAGGQSVFSEQ